MRSVLLAILISGTAFSQNLVETVDGMKGTGYIGLGDLAKIKYLPITVRDGELPQSFNWADIDGVISEVKDQGNCGSCWAFAIIAALESAEVIQDGKQVGNYSEQHMVSCDRYSYGCNGGFMSSADFLVRSGVTDETGFPYTARNSRCKSGLDIKAKISKYYLIDKPNVSKIKTALVNNGPLFVTVMAGGAGWGGQTERVTSCRKRGTTNHMVLLTGWDEKGWVIKNSWGKKWGKDGFSSIGFGCDLIGQEAGFLDIVSK